MSAAAAAREQEQAEMRERMVERARKDSSPFDAPEVDSEWDRSTVLALAQYNCTTCCGTGMRLSHRLHASPCNCVLRRIFRICFNKYKQLVDQPKYLSQVKLANSGVNFASASKRGGGSSAKTGIAYRLFVIGRPHEEYIADFCLVSRRALTGKEHALFRMHFLLGEEWSVCCGRLGIDRGNFFHAVYRIEQKLGRVFRELEPYALFPLDEYFHGPTKSWGVIEPKRAVKDTPLRAPVRG